MIFYEKFALDCRADPDWDEHIGTIGEAIRSDIVRSLGGEQHLFWLFKKGETNNKKTKVLQVAHEALKKWTHLPPNLFVPEIQYGCWSEAMDLLEDESVMQATYLIYKRIIKNDYLLSFESFCDYMSAKLADNDVVDAAIEGKIHLDAYETHTNKGQWLNWQLDYPRLAKEAGIDDWD